MDRAQRILRREKESEPDEQQTELPRYFIVINIDGVIAFTNSEQAEKIPILGLVYSVKLKRSAFSKEPEIFLETRYPFGKEVSFYPDVKPPEKDSNVKPKLLFMASGL